MWKKLLRIIKCLFGEHVYEYRINKGWKCQHCPHIKKGLIDFSSISKSSISLTGFDALKK